MQSNMFTRTYMTALARTLLVALLSAGGNVALTRTVQAQQSCNDGSECTTIDSCQADGSCKGTNKPNGTACTPSTVIGDCVISAACQLGACVPVEMKPINTPCTNALLGPCMTDATCQFGGFCFGAIKECPDDGNKCTIEVCNPQNGACTSVPNDCNDDCTTGQCDAGTGECVNTQNRPDGTTCDDFHECTNNDRCSNGKCGGSTTPVGTATHTPTGLPSFTPTATPQLTTPTLSATTTRTPTLSATATRTPTGPSSFTPTVSATATQTLATPPTTTSTVPSVPTSTATPQPVPPCAGDCGGDNEVTIDDLIKGVNIALGSLPVGDCRSLDTNGDGEVTVNELIKGVNNALSGCPTPAPTETPTTTPTATATPSATPSATVTFTLVPPSLTPTATTTVAASATPSVPPSGTTTPSQAPTQAASATATFLSTTTPTLQATLTPTTSAPPTPSATGGEEPSETPEPTETPEPSATEEMTPTPGGPSIPLRAAGAIQGTTTGLLVVPNILSAILGHTGGLGAGSGAGLVTVPFSCPAGGSGGVSCDQSIVPKPPFFGPPTYTVTLNNCMVAGTGSTTLTFNGTVVATGQQGDFCGTIPSDVAVTIPNLTVVSQGTGGMTTSTFTDVSGSVSLSGQDNACTYNAATFNLVGTMKVESKDPQGAPLGSTGVTFNQGSSIEISVTQYGNSCVPTIYDTTVQGGITFSSNGNSFAATFTDYMIHNDASSGSNMLTVKGAISSPCLGAAIQLSTETDLLLLGAAPCPHAGAVLVMSGDTTDLVSYTDSGGVQIDLGNNGGPDQTFASCLDPALFQCPAS